jgi:hypothetical protein
MNGTDSLTALRRANPRHKPEFIDLADAVATRAASHAPFVANAPQQPAGPRLRHRLHVRVLAVAALVMAVTTLGALAFGSRFEPSTVPPAAAMQEAVAVSAGAADASGTVSVAMTKDGVAWAGKTVRWNGADLSVTDDVSSRPGKGELRVVDGMMYAPDPETPGGWMELGSPDSIDPGSGTTPDEYLAAAREDAGGATLRRITEAMTGLTATRSDQGSTIYTGRVAAGVLARETGFKEGAVIRVLPYGFVAHDDAADPASLIPITITVGPGDTIAEIAAEWGGASAWTYRLSFRDLGSTPSPSVPDNVKPLLKCRALDRAGRPAC